MTAVAAAATGLATLAGCSEGSVSVQPAPQASSAACAGALRHLPATVLGRSRVALDVPGAAEWGKPAIVARCGLPEVAPTTLPCLTVDAVDWVIDDRHDPIVFTTFGRSPALEVGVPVSYGRSNASAALADLAAVAGALPRTQRACIG